MNRTGLGLAVGAGYLLGRTRKLKMAFAVGTLVVLSIFLRQRGSPESKPVPAPHARTGSE